MSDEDVDRRAAGVVDALKARVAELEATAWQEGYERLCDDLAALKARLAELERTQCTESERAILDVGHRLGWTTCTPEERAVLDAMDWVKYARLMQIVRFATDELVEVAKAELARRESTK
jgi:hypothetical protein